MKEEKPCSHNPLLWLLAGVLVIVIMELAMMPRIEQMCAGAMANVICPSCKEK